MRALKLSNSKLDYPGNPYPDPGKPYYGRAENLKRHRHMLIGEYIHTIDEKKRISLPAKFRSQLGEHVVLTKGLDNCIFLYSQQEWKNITERLSELSLGKADSRGLNRFMFSGAIEVLVDNSGRILLPDFLKKFAHLENKAVLAGVSNRVELWNEERWRAYKEKIENEVDDLAEKLGDIGMI